MPILKVLNQIFIFVFPAALITTFISIRNNENWNKCVEHPDEIKKNDHADKKIYVFLLISKNLFLIVVAVIAWNSFPQNGWIVFLLFIPLLFWYFTNRLVSSSIAIHILSNVICSNDNSTLSATEKIAIQVVACFVWLLSILNPYKTIRNYIVEYPNPIVSDGLMSLLLVGVSFLYVFLTMVLIFTSISYTVKLIDNLKHLPMGRQIQKIDEYFVNKVDLKIKCNLLLFCIADYIRKSRHPAKYLLYFLVPMVYIVDMLRFVLVLMLYELRSAIGYIFIFLHMISSIIRMIFKRFLKLSDRHIVVVSFRIAIIFALVSIVILNRYQPVFKEYEASTAVFEFLASSIIIPVAFEWIYAIRNKSGTQEG